ncbi:MAG TPA: alpha/beta hydrolase [Opitutaceae bacterium]|nr:alpha/beta hydrolase [Opitutaceae bacterium]
MTAASSRSLRFRRATLALLFAAILPAGFSAGEAPRPALLLNVWPGLPPGDKPNLGEEKHDPQQMIRGVVTTPTLAIYRPAKEKDTGAAVLIAPGGGFFQLSMGHEGADVAAWLNTLGVTGAVLKYRIPVREGMARSLPMTQDAQRAMSILRAHAAEWGLDPNRIGLCGFSAGGEVAVNVLTHPGQRLYDAIDDTDRAPMNPNFSLLIYTGGIAKPGVTPPALNDDIVFPKNTPPAFLSVSDNDPGAAQTALLYFALHQAGVPAELHVWTEGGHGYGIRRGPQPHTTWPERAADWLKVRGFLQASAAAASSTAAPSSAAPSPTTSSASAAKP